MGALNHCYLKFGRCGWLLNLDIDEYLVSEDGTSLQDYTRQTPRHYLGLAERRVQGYSNILEKPRATINSPREKFWVYHFSLLGTEWRPSRENRVLYRDKAYFEAKGLEITYDNVMIKQAEKHSL